MRILILSFLLLSSCNKQTESESYWLNTKSGVRHNSSCQYFKNTQKGRICNENKGKACGICGG